MKEGELCVHCRWPQRDAETYCLLCHCPICQFDGYPQYQGTRHPTPFLRRICYLCLSKGHLVAQEELARATRVRVLDSDGQPSTEGGLP